MDKITFYCFDIDHLKIPIVIGLVNRQLKMFCKLLSQKCHNGHCLLNVRKKRNSAGYIVIVHFNKT